jgi:hypothetical protein
MIHPLIHLGFPCRLVVADRLSGERTEFLEALLALDLGFVVAMRANHGVLLGPGQRVRYTSWKAVDRGFAEGTCERRYICEIIFGQRRDIRYYQLTTDPKVLPEESTWFVLTNWSQASLQAVGHGYGMRTWIEYGFRQSQQELGWTDFRVTSYPAIERWWEMVYSAYLMVSLQAEVFIGPLPVLSPGDLEAAAYTTGGQEAPCRAEDITPEAPALALRQHTWGNAGKGWKHALNNLRLLIQPFSAYCLLSPWLEIITIPALQEGWGQ